jgi:hypothetical protein
MSIFPVILASAKMTSLGPSVNKGEPTVLSALTTVYNVLRHAEIPEEACSPRRDYFFLKKKLHLKEQLPVGATISVDGFNPAGTAALADRDFWREMRENAKNAAHFPPRERLTISCACSTMAARWSALFRLSA